MKALITTFAIVAGSLLMFACGGKTETKQNETKTAPVVSTVSTASPAANNVASSIDGDRDDIKSPTANSTNSTSKRADLDDVKKASKSATTSPPKKSGDDDDRGKKDSHGDDDDR